MHGLKKTVVNQNNRWVLPYYGQEKCVLVNSSVICQLVMFCVCVKWEGTEWVRKINWEGKMLKTVKQSAKIANTRLCLVSPQYDAQVQWRAM